MKKYLLSIFLISTLSFANLPKRVSDNIERDTVTQDNRNLYIREQKRAYMRILSLGKKEGLTEENIDEQVKILEKRYGTNYEIIYKNFYYDVKELSKNEKKKEKYKKINEDKKEEYNTMLKNVDIPSDIKEYIEKLGENKYPNNYSERVKYSEELINFYNFIKK